MYLKATSQDNNQEKHVSLSVQYVQSLWKTNDYSSKAGRCWHVWKRSYQNVFKEKDHLAGDC